MKYTYNEFNDKFEDFKYKYQEDLEKAFQKVSNLQTSVRGVKIRGVYDSVQQAENVQKNFKEKIDHSMFLLVK